MLNWKLMCFKVNLIWFCEHNKSPLFVLISCDSTLVLSFRYVSWYKPTQWYLWIVSIDVTHIDKIPSQFDTHHWCDSHIIAFDRQYLCVIDVYQSIRRYSEYLTTFNWHVYSEANYVIMILVCTKTFFSNQKIHAFKSYF